MTKATCSRCGRTYEAYSSQATINYKLRNGRPIFCPECVTLVQREVRIRNNQERYNPDAPKEFLAPCHMTIVPARESARARCKPGREARCPIDDYDVCLDFTARAGWDGWKVKCDM